MNALRRLIARARRMGFEGPYYTGLRGKARFVLESTVCRREMLFVATPASHASAVAPASPSLTLTEINAHAGFDAYTATLEREYYAGYTNAWRAPFTWGEHALVADIDGRFAGVAWLQTGHSRGYPTYWGRLLEGDARILRVGVLPSMRRRGVNTALLYQALARRFALGTERVFIECYEHNLPSLRSFLKVGFHPIALLDVFEAPGLRGYVRWRGQDELTRELASLHDTRPPQPAFQ